MPFCGLVVFNDGESYADKKWAFWNDRTCTRQGTGDVPVDGKTIENLHFFNHVDLSGWNNLVNGNLMVYDCKRTGELYLRCDAGTPGEIFASIEFTAINGASMTMAGEGTVTGICGGCGGGACQTHGRNRPGRWENHRL